jgi:hypothetical protein
MAVSKKTGTPKAVKFGPQMVSNLKVRYSHLAKPDLEYNTGHSVTVEVNKDLKDAFKEMTAQSGVSHINGLKKDEEGVELAKFKTSVYSNDGVQKFPKMVDTKSEACDAPFGGDIINLIFQPKVWNVNNKEQISCYLKEIQVVEQNSGSSVTFMKPKQTEVSNVSEEDTRDDLPF